MASQTRNASSPASLTTRDTSCATLSSGSQDATMSTFTTAIPSDAIFSSYQFRLAADTQPPPDSPTFSATLYVRVSTGSFCGGHSMAGLIFAEDGCSAGDDYANTITCGHGAAYTPTTRAAAIGNTYIIRITHTSGETAYLNHVDHTWNYTVPVPPSAPADPSIAPDGIGDLGVQSNTPYDGGATITDVRHQISLSPTFASGNITWTKGGAPANPQYHQFTGLGNGAGPYYARAQYYNTKGWGAWNASPYNSNTTWSVPGAPGDATYSDRSTSIITFDWTAASAGSGTPPSSLIEYHYQWKPDGGGYTHVDTNSLTLSASKDSLSAGTKYWFEVHAVNLVGDGAWSNETAHWTLCDTPTIDSVVADAVGQLKVSWSTETGVNTWNLERSPNGSSGWTEVQYDIAGGTLFYNDTVANGATWYYRLNAENADGNPSAWSSNGTGTAWDVPGTADPSSSIPEGSMIRITKNAVDPDDGGGTPSEPIDTWKVYRSSTSGGSYTALSGDIAIATTIYDDWSTNGGEEWFYKVKYKNLVGESAFSNYTSQIASTPEITKTSDTWIRIPFFKLSDTTIMKVGEISRVSNTTIKNADQSITTLSDSTIFQSGWDSIDVLSNTRIKTTDSVETLSDSRIKNSYEKTPLSDSAIFNPGYGLIDTISDTRIIEEGTVILPPVYSDSRILIAANELTKLSDTFIKLNIDITKTTDTTIFNAGYGLVNVLSDTAIFRVSFDEKTILSDTAIYIEGFDDKTKLSDTRIKREGGYMYPFQKSEIPSDTRIKRTFRLDLLSLTRIEDLDKEITKLSDTLIMIYPKITKISDTVIRVLESNELLLSSRTKIVTPFTLDKLSDSTINLSSKLTKTSDSFIIKNPTISIVSNTAIFRSGFDTKDKTSDTLIVDIVDITVSSDTTIFRASYGEILKFSHTEIQILANKITKTSDSSILITVDIPILSDTSIRRDRSNLNAIFQKGRQL